MTLKSLVCAKIK